MNIHWHGALCVAVLLIAATCTRAEEPLLCMVTPTSPKECKTAAAWEAEDAVRFAKQREYAEALPFDYRDLLRTLLVEYIHSVRLPGTRQQYFVSVFGSDVDAALTARLHESGIDVAPASAWTLTDDRQLRAGDVMRVKIQVSDLKQVAPDTFVIRIGYYCGPRCASSEEYELQKDGQGWRIVGRRMDWVAFLFGGYLSLESSKATISPSFAPSLSGPGDDVTLLGIIGIYAKQFAKPRHQLPCLCAV